jgi:glycosyltransferase involved in cell wall biosynthesis
VTHATISIVTPSYNQGRYLEWTIRSVFWQRYPKIQYVIMDGGSQDQTVNIIRKYEPFLHHWQSAADKGQADAIRNGFLQTSGEIMGYLNSDDMLGPNALHWVSRFFRQHPEVDAVYSHRCAVDSCNNVIWYWILPNHSDYLMKRWDLIPQETCFWRRKIYEKVGGIDSGFRFAMDYDLFVRIMGSGRMYRANRFLGAFRQHPNAKTSTELDSVGQNEIKRVWKQYGLRHFAWDNVVGPTYIRTVELRSYLFAHSRRTLPGSAPGLGYNYDSLWGGLLCDHRIPPSDV